MSKRPAQTLPTRCTTVGFRPWLHASAWRFAVRSACPELTPSRHPRPHSRRCSDGDKIPKGAVPAYLLDREGTSRAKVLSNTVKQKRKEKAGKWAVPIPKVRSARQQAGSGVFGHCICTARHTDSLAPRQHSHPSPKPLSLSLYAPPLPPQVKPVSDEEMFRSVITGKKRDKAWKRMVTKVCFVPPDFTRKAPKYERFIRPAALRFKKAHVTHPELQVRALRNSCMPRVVSGACS